MAKHPPIVISGKIANLIFYNRQGTPCVRARPRRVRQTKATKASAQQFAVASRLARCLHEIIYPLYDDLEGRDHILRWRTAVYKWILESKPDKNTIADELPFIYWFEFNPESSLYARLKVKPSVNWNAPNNIILTIPALTTATDIAAPADTVTVHWKIIAGRATMEERSNPIAIGEAEIDMPYNKTLQAEQQITLPIEVEKGEVIVIGVSLRYTVIRKGRRKLITEKRWLPVGIVGACCGTG